MIQLKTARELERMKKACRLSARALEIAQSVIAPGVSTAYVDRKIREFITSQGARPTFLNYGGFPGSACVSVNEELIHGIPS
ncbi:MAG: M24 family metallopeptidase, partial [Oscillospiraceae bacterium]|nr:M24 family metallopeptidase [Oscillospiraceae bacterium]